VQSRPLDVENSLREILRTLRLKAGWTPMRDFAGWIQELVAGRLSLKVIEVSLLSVRDVPLRAQWIQEAGADDGAFRCKNAIVDFDARGRNGRGAHPCGDIDDPARFKSWTHSSGNRPSAINPARPIDRVGSPRPTIPPCVRRSTRSLSRGRIRSRAARHPRARSCALADLIFHEIHAGTALRQGRTAHVFHVKHTTARGGLILSISLRVPRSAPETAVTRLPPNRCRLFVLTSRCRSPERSHRECPRHQHDPSTCRALAWRALAPRRPAPPQPRPRVPKRD